MRPRVVATLAVASAVRALDRRGDLHFRRGAGVLPAVEAVLLRAGAFEVSLPEQRVGGVGHEAGVGLSILTLLVEAGAARVGRLIGCGVWSHAAMALHRRCLTEAHGDEWLAFASAST